MSGSAWVSDDEVYSSLEYQQYLLILDEEEHASYYAREELIAAREREALAHPPLPYRDEYQAYLRTPEWRERAEAAKARFGYRCALCNSSTALEAHHRTYERIFDELPEDLTALSSDCHAAYHRWRIGAEQS